MKPKKGAKPPATDDAAATAVAVEDPPPAPPEEPAVAVELPPLPKMLQRSYVKKDLDCRLSDAEMLELGKQLARANTELEEAEEKKREVTKQLAADVESARNNAVSLSRRLNRGAEFREVNCEVIRDLETCTVRTVRLDTYEVVSERAMTDEERQLKLDWEERAAAAADTQAQVDEAAAELADEATAGPDEPEDVEELADDEEPADDEVAP